MKTLKTTRRLLLTAATLVLGATTVHAQDATITWPELNSTYLKTGDFVNLDNLRSMGDGLNYDQVRLLLGNPHFNEGFGNPRAFNYAFNFYTNTAKTEWTTCQYQVTFTQAHKVDGRYWRDPQCAQYLNNAPQASAPVITQAPTALSADGMFAFGRSGLMDLQATGRARLDQLAQQILTDYSQLRSVEVVGHTDRIGSASSNMALSVARANTVKQYFISRGIDGSKIRTQGVGSMQPVTFCNGATSPKVIACLMPNRRIEISVNGDK